LIQAQAGRDRAERSAAMLAEVQDFFLGDIFGSADVYDSGNQFRTILEAVDAGAHRTAHIVDPEVRAAIEHQIGAVYLSIGELGKARAFLESALKVRAGLQTQEGRESAARTQLKLAEVLRKQKETTAAAALIRDARAARASLFGEASPQAI